MLLLIVAGIIVVVLAGGLVAVWVWLRHTRAELHHTRAEVAMLRHHVLHTPEPEPPKPRLWIVRAIALGAAIGELARRYPRPAIAAAVVAAVVVVALLWPVLGDGGDGDSAGRPPSRQPGPGTTTTIPAPPTSTIDAKDPGATPPPPGQAPEEATGDAAIQGPPGLT
ncbi:MAG: hypothetical protein ACRD0A_10210, partial [Acidimicrobiales bacterium]